MKTSAIIEGLTIIEKYRDTPHGFNTGAEHDAIYAYPTDRPIGGDDLARLVELGWLQEGTECDDADDAEFDVQYYDQAESWVCYP